MSGVLGPDGRAQFPTGLPTGTVTFVFTDIEGSTQRWERDRAAMDAALRRHDSILRTALEASRGYIFKTMGDAFCVAFAQPKDAAAAALNAQQALAAEDFSAVDGLRVRMALAVGSAQERDGDYFGPTVNRVARLLGIGHGAQVLVSGAAAELLEGALPEGAALIDLGVHRLKDLARPEHVFQLAAPELRRTFPALTSLDVLPHNLPRQLSSFVGRDTEISQIEGLIAESALVTLVGTGGVGKTRCAIQVGALLLDGSGDGVWLVELAPLGDESHVASAIAGALGVAEAPNRPLLETVVAYLKRQRLLLILDNCEHVIGEARRVVATIVRSCPEVRILATSRERLNIAGERVYRMPSLAVPRAGEKTGAAAASRYGALALFSDRARATDRHFEVSDENAPVVTEICRRLDGIPLALELAAARIKLLSPPQLLLKLDERFRVLTGGDRSALPRQQTMRALIDWSYDLLDEDERGMFRKLAIFAGGFTLETASAVCAQNGVDEFAVLDRLSSLVDKSLVHAEPGDRGTRYSLLESTRQYAREKLLEGGEFASVARKHALAFVALAERLDRDWETTEDREWFALVEPEVENWRAALEWTLETRADVPLGQELAGAIRRSWRFFGATERQRSMTVALQAVDEATPPRVAARLDLVDARSKSTVNQYKAAIAVAENALARCRQFDDPFLTAEIQTEVGYALIGLGRVTEGEALMDEVLAASQHLSARKLMGEALLGLAQARYFSDDIAGSRARFAEALAVAKATGNATLAALVAGNLAEAEFRGGDAAAALQTAAAGLADHRALKDLRQIANNLCNSAAYLASIGRYDEAREHAREALPLARDVQYDVIVIFSLQHLAAIGALRSDDDGERRRADRVRAAALLGFVDKRLAAIAALREYTEQVEYDRLFAELGRRLGHDRLASALAEGAAWDEERAVEEAMLV